jgi:hypothetical protein
MAPSVCGIKEDRVKQLKTKRKFKFYKGRWRKAPLPLKKGTRLIQYCFKLLVAAGEVVNDWDKGDLAAAVRSLDKTLQEIDAKISVKQRQVIVLIIEYRNGRNVYACQSEARAISELYSFVAEYWNEMPEGFDKIPMNRQEAIKVYFEEKDSEESFEILTLPVLPTHSL